MPTHHWRCCLSFTSFFVDPAHNYYHWWGCINTQCLQRSVLGRGGYDRANCHGSYWLSWPLFWILLQSTYHVITCSSLSVFCEPLGRSTVYIVDCQVQLIPLIDAVWEELSNSCHIVNIGQIWHRMCNSGCGCASGRALHKVTPFLTWTVYKRSSIEADYTPYR